MTLGVKPFCTNLTWSRNADPSLQVTERAFTGDGPPGGGGACTQAKHAAVRMIAQSGSALRIIKVLPDGARAAGGTGAPRSTPFTMVYRARFYLTPQFQI